MTNIQVPSADVRRTSAVAPSAVRLAGKAFVHDQCTSARSIASNALPVSAGWRTSQLTQRGVGAGSPVLQGGEG